jgi:predicted metal-binding membrane protein
MLVMASAASWHLLWTAALTLLVVAERRAERPVRLARRTAVPLAAVAAALAVV